MKSLTNSDIDILIGPKVCKAWCTGGKVDVIKFSDLFLNANFKTELSVYAFLHRDQHWKELLKALESFDTGVHASGELHYSSISATNHQRASAGVDRSDMESALQRLLALNLVTEGISVISKRQVMKRTCEITTKNSISKPSKLVTKQACVLIAMCSQECSTPTILNVFYVFCSFFFFRF